MNNLLLVSSGGRMDFSLLQVIKNLTLSKHFLTSAERSEMCDYVQFSRINDTSSAKMVRTSRNVKTLKFFFERLTE